jgi:hypothetical protein
MTSVALDRLRQPGSSNAFGSHRSTRHARLLPPAVIPTCAGTVAGGLLTLAIWLLGRRALDLANLGGAWTSTRVVETAACGLSVLAAAWLIAAVIAGAIVTVTANHPRSRAHQAALTIAPAYALRFYALAAGIGLALTALVTTAPPIKTTPIAPEPLRPEPAAIEPADVPIGLFRQPNALREETLATQSSLTTETSAVSESSSSNVSATSVPSSEVSATSLALSASNTVVVQPGDSLWQIAAANLPPDATTADIAAAWPAWYELNADTIGPDPNVILPGQVLRTPFQS